jgi:UDP-N-acetylglucosamine--dolichyl-phosphate N-acetylglucosaminephosphotransferase
MIAGIIGFVDDIFGWAHGGLSARLRVFLVLIAAIPLMVINAGSSIVSVPFIGLVDFGLIYPLLIIPIGIIGATTAYNFLAGFNGLETGQGIIIISFLSLIAYMVGLNWLTLIGFCMVAGLIAFLIYNWFPARVFPGDVLTYSIGALIACLAILGNFEKLAVFIFIPYILEFFLKLRGGLKKSSFGKPQEDGSLELLHDKIYGLEHLEIYILKRAKPSRKVYEKDVVFLIFGFQIFVCLLGFLIFGGIL